MLLPKPLLLLQLFCSSILTWCHLLYMVITNNKQNNNITNNITFGFNFICKLGWFVQNLLSKKFHNFNFFFHVLMQFTIYWKLQQAKQFAIDYGLNMSMPMNDNQTRPTFERNLFCWLVAVFFKRIAITTLGCCMDRGWLMHALLKIN